MSVTAVVELSRELHRLAVAGVGLARGDRRVAALVPALEKSGEKVAVFARIAERTNALLVASKGDAPGEFLQLNTLVGAVLKTQGRSGVDGELVPPPPSATSAGRIPLRALNELRLAVDYGHTVALHGAIERGWFGDVRLARFALEALESDNAELANLAARKLVPPYGKAVVPLLVASLDLSSRRPAARVIETVGRVDARSGEALARQILDPEADREFALDTTAAKVSDEAYAAALGLLGDDAVDRGVLLDFLDAKRKALRVAALSRLLALGDTDAESRVVTMLGGSAAKSREAIEAIPALSGPAMAEPVIARAHALAKALGAKKPTSADANDAVRVLALLARSDADAERFGAAFALFERFETVRGLAGELRARAVPAIFGYLIAACPTARRKALARLALPLEPRVATLAAIRRLGPVEALSFLELAKASDFRNGIAEVFPDDPDDHLLREPDLPPPSEWSVEWLELGFRYDSADLVDYLWSLDPASTVKHLLGRRKVYGDVAILALTTDPGCADAVRRRLATDGDDLGCFERLCEAIVAGERDRALELVAAVPDYYRPERVATLRTRLIEHFSGTAA